MWNKREKELAEYQLNAEEKVLKQLEHHYRMALEDVKLAIQIMQTDEQTISKIHQIKYQKTLQKQLEGIVEKLHLGEYKSLKQYLTDCYTDSFIGTLYDMHGQGVPVIAPVDQQAAIKAIQLDTKLTERKIHANENGEMVALYESLGIDTDKLKQTIRSEITRGIATGMRYEDIARNISNVSKAPLSRAKTIARTEGHRIQQASAEDARQMAKAKGADVVKQWDASLDGATRKTHRELDGQIQEVNKPFTTGTKKAMYPGDFGLPEEDCNCRCAALTRARWALDEDELKTLKERAAFFKLTEDKKQTFADFKQKYLSAIENVEDFESDTIKELVKKAESGAEITQEDFKHAGRELRKQIEESKVKISKEIAQVQKEIDALEEQAFEALFSGNGSDDVLEKESKLSKQKAELQAKLKPADILSKELAKYREVGYPSGMSRESFIKEQFRYNRYGLGDYHLVQQREAMEYIADACAKYPSAWLKSSVNYGKIETGYSTSKRGFYNHSKTQLHLSGESDSAAIRNAFHEMAHRLEKVVPGLAEAEKAFYKSRTQGEPLVDLITFNSNYAKDEKTRTDGFVHPYMGKEYVYDNTYELCSMGFEYLYTAPEMLEDDKDMYDWLLGILLLK